MVLQDITTYIRGFVPSAQLICETQHEFSYILPKKNSRKGALKNLFASLEANKESLACHSFGLSDTTLEEVGSFVEINRDNFIEQRNLWQIRWMDFTIFRQWQGQYVLFEVIFRDIVTLRSKFATWLHASVPLIHHFILSAWREETDVKFPSDHRVIFTVHKSFPRPLLCNFLFFKYRNILIRVKNLC